MAAQKLKDQKPTTEDSTSSGPKLETKLEPQATSLVHKVAPYPIAVDITKVEGQPPLKGSIVKMTEIGFLMRVDTIHFYKVGENLHLSFKLPAVNFDVRCDGKVIKTYDAIELAGDQKGKLYTVEIHFKSMIEKERNSIITYLVKSGQKKL